MVKILHLSDIHLGSGFSHGRLNPETGLNTRFEDFVKTLSLCMDRAIAEPVDLVLFGGDAFPDATPPPLVQDAFASQFRRLADAGIPAVLLVGNHDQHSQGQGGASLCIYRTLGVPGIVVGDRLMTHHIETRQGPVQVITLPWITRSTLLARNETENLSLTEINELLIDRLRVALEGEIRQLNPELPSILLGHLMTDTAHLGAERFLAAGKGFTIPMALLARPCFDYVALGHVHRHQILCDAPPVVYPGSIERVDFSEEKEEKGYVRVDLQRGNVRVEFCPLPVRRFQTIKLDLSEAENPQAELLAALEAEILTDAVVRLVYQVQSIQLDHIDLNALQEALSPAHSYSIYPELTSQLARARLPELGSSNSTDPLEALQAYLDTQPHLADLNAELLSAAEALLSSDDLPVWIAEDGDLPQEAISETASAQLRLL
ncbi:exonuclease subunit SbcD [Leptolyngbya sp. FACHB-16]|uniref:exonuclease subunit SbcD n=1 Tax=unclassified Leptolyngbya TaxID=2650499 RepID=UPI00168940AB|nr:exonuclease subunit SbcD [Leptolyngbya sp. FACHB-16]MBD2155954.1 exonuclease subunit SbcD [Leptolyngbya sp. FACHB-16]